MSSTSIATLVKMVESLPENAQEHVVEHVREYLADLQDEMRWDDAFKKTPSKLVAAGRKARQEIADGHATPMGHSQL